MSSQLFGTDGIRGPAGTYPLDDAGLRQIGIAVGMYFAEPGDHLPVGWDPRESSEGLVLALVEGLQSTGVNIDKLGVLPTPGLAYVTKKRGAKAGVMITASHNPYTDNGVKVFTGDGRKLTDKDQAGLNGLIGTEVQPRGNGTAADDFVAAKEYETFLLEAADGTFDRLKLAVDTANGATSGIGARVFEKLGADVTPLADKPDGRNINVGCGATDTAALRRTVTEQKLDGGIAFDGDGDRVMLVDAKGRELTGDHILYILAVAGKQTGVVATIMSNQGLESALKNKGMGFERTAVGDRSVLQGLDKTGFRLGGEQSGHIILPEFSPTGDGLLAAIKTLSLVKASGRTLDQWYDELKLLPQALVSIPFANKARLEEPAVKSFIEEQSAALEGQGRLNVRPSGTEPKIRVMVEAPDAETKARAIADRLAELGAA